MAAPTPVLTIGRYDAAVRTVQVGTDCVELLEVANLEELVDRDALLRNDDPLEPPYWAHLWTGALQLAYHLDADQACAGRRVLDLGCGLGLVGIVAALGGGLVTFLDRDADALVFAAASAARNGCRPEALCQLDFTSGRLDRGFDLILAAEVLYDQAAFAPLLHFLSAHLAPGGTILLADAHRTNTEKFHEALAAAGYRSSTQRVRAWEDGLPLTVDIVAARRGTDGRRRVRPTAGGEASVVGTEATALLGSKHAAREAGDP